MKVKQIMALGLSAGMALSSAFCGSAAAEETDETYNVVMTIPTVGSEPSGLADVEAAINEITEPAIGVTVTLYPIYVYDLSSQINLMLSSGDKLDLILCTNWTGSMVTSLVDKGALLELDDLYAEYGSDIEAAEGIAVAGGYYNGSLYAIPSEEKQARQYGFMARTDIVEELGFSFDADTVYTLDDLEELFATYKEAYGDGYYCISGTGSSSDFFTFANLTDYLGASTSSGVLMGGGLDGDTTIENLYATEEYAEYAQRMYEWAQLGYYSADASTNTDAASTQIMAGNYLGIFMDTETDMKSNCTRDYGYDMTVINLTDKYAATQLYQSTMWSIPTYCENPEKTFEFLNLLYADNDLDNILTNGLEGVSYEWIEKGKKKDRVWSAMQMVWTRRIPRIRWHSMCLAISSRLRSMSR